jgi:hypothetical protein
MIPETKSRVVMPKDDDKDYNPEIDQLIEDKIFDELFENDLYERQEGGI